MSHSGGSAFPDRGNLTFYAVLAALVLLVGAGPLLERKIFAFMFKVERVADNVYVGYEMSYPDRERFLRNYALARQKVASFFGGVSAEPRVVACSTWACYERIGGVRPRGGQVQHGAAYGKKFFQISPASLGSLATVTHEYAHIEIAARLGLRGKFDSLPVWFNEGLAALISEDELYSEEAYEKLKAAGPVVDVRKSKGGVQSLGPGGVRSFYILAAHEVRMFMKRAGGRGAIIELLARLKAGESFDRVYNEMMGQAGRRV